MKLDKRQMMPLALGVAGLVGVGVAFQLYTLDANLRASAGITKSLKAEVEKLTAENQSILGESQSRQAELGKLSQELESLRARDTASGKRNEELEKLIGDSEKTLGNQNAKIAELETRLREAEERVKRQREKSEDLASAARDAKSGAATEYVKLMESEWLKAVAQTESLQKDLEEAMMELADGNTAKARMQKETATMHYNLAVILTGQGKFEAAIREYERVLQMKPDDPDAHYNLAVLYDTELKNRSQALEHYRRYVESAPDRPDAAKVKLWIKDKEFEGRLDHPSFLPKEEKRF